MCSGKWFQKDGVLHEHFNNFTKQTHGVHSSHNLEEMKIFYLQFLGAKIAFEVPDVLVFLRYDEEHHRLGIIGMPDIGDKVKKSNGLEVRSQ